MHLLGLVHSFTKQNTLSNIDDLSGNTTLLIDKAKVIFRENIEAAIKAEQVAEQLAVSYALFRKVFKTYTGIAPRQYLIQLKVETGKQLLALPDKLIKEIAYDLGFDSCFYFSKLFKEKTGLSPVSYRDRYKSRFKS